MESKISYWFYKIAVLHKVIYTYVGPLFFHFRGKRMEFMESIIEMHNYFIIVSLNHLCPRNNQLVDD